MRSRNKWAGAVILLAVLVAGASWFLLRDSHGAAQNHSGQPSAEHQQALQVAEALQRLAVDPASLVAAGARSEVGDQARRAVPAGSVVTPRVDSWEPDGVGGGIMTVTIAAPGKPPVDFAAVMVRERGAWKVMATLQLPGRADPSTAGAR